MLKLFLALLALVLGAAAIVEIIIQLERKHDSKAEAVNRARSATSASR